MKPTLRERYMRLMGPNAARDVDDELAFHLEMRAQELIARGEEPARARELARQRFGDVTAPREECVRLTQRREKRVARGELLAGFTQDLGYALRGLARTPALTFSGIATVALGVGATTVVLSLIHTMLLRPLPVANPEELVAIHEQRTGSSSSSFGQVAMLRPRFDAYREATSSVFSGFAADRDRNFALRTPDGARATPGTLIAGNYFGVLGLRPAAGRFFVDDAEQAAVISHALWQTRFSGAEDVIGSTIHVDRRLLTVVGVAPRGFTGVRIGPQAHVWVPARAYSQLKPTNVEMRELTLVSFARLAPGVTAERAQTVVDVVARRIPPEEPNTKVQGARLEKLTALPAGVRGPVIGFFGLLLGTATLVLLIAGANIAGMLLARGVARRREVAVRLAIGAGRARLVRQFLTETLALFVLGGIAGCILAAWVTGMLSRMSLPIDDGVSLDFSVDWRILSVALAWTAFTGILFGLAPALQSSRLSLIPALKEGGAHGATRAARGRSVFVAAQLAMAVLLLVTTGLFARSLQHALAASPGFDANGIVLAAVDLSPHGYDKERGRAFYDELIERVRAMPEVESAGLASVVMLTHERESNDIEVIDTVAGGEKSGKTTSFNVVDAGYMQTMRIPIVAGRTMEERDRNAATPAVIVNEVLARRLWPGASALGRHIRINGRDLEVVGVAAQGRYTSPGELPGAFAFIHHASVYVHGQTLHVRPRPGVKPTDVIAQIRAAVRAIDPDVAVQDTRLLEQALAFALFPQRFGATVIGAFGLIGLILAAIGVYGVLAFHVAQRTREIGVRMALGARASQVLKMVIGRGVILAVTGAVIGLVLASGVGFALRRMLLGLEPLDPVTFLLAPALLLIVALAAGYLPARRAMRVDVVEALRGE